MDSMVPCYSLLNMNVICLYLVSAPPPILVGEGGVAYYENLPKFCDDKVFSHICGRKNLYGWSLKQMGK